MTTICRTGVLRASVLTALGLVLLGCATTEGGEPGVGETTADPTIAAARMAFDEIADGLAAGDPAALRELSAGPAAAFFAHADHLRRASGTEPGELFPNSRAEPGGAAVDGDGVRFPGPVIWGDPEGPPPRVLTDLLFTEDEDGWVLRSFTRNDVPIERWVTPAADETAGAVPVTGQVVGVFVDVTCLEGTDPECPEFLGQDSLAVDFEVTNDSEAPLEPVEVTLPDGSTSAAWLETPSGEPQPLRDAVLQGLPPGEASPVTALVGGADAMDQGGILHIALKTADGTVHPVDLPVPAYPASWDERHGG